MVANRGEKRKMKIKGTEREMRSGAEGREKRRRNMDWRTPARRGELGYNVVWEAPGKWEIIKMAARALRRLTLDSICITQGRIQCRYISAVTNITNFCPFHFPIACTFLKTHFCFFFFVHLVVLIFHCLNSIFCAKTNIFKVNLSLRLIKNWKNQ